MGVWEQKQFIGQIWVSLAVYMINILPGTVIGVFTLFIYAVIISLRTDLFLFCFPEQSNKGRVLISPGPSYYFFQVNIIIRFHKGKRVQVGREVGTILYQKWTESLLWQRGLLCQPRCLACLGQCLFTEGICVLWNNVIVRWCFSDLRVLNLKV